MLYFSIHTDTFTQVMLNTYILLCRACTECLHEASGIETTELSSHIVYFGLVAAGLVINFTRVQNSIEVVSILLTVANALKLCVTKLSSREPLCATDEIEADVCDRGDDGHLNEGDSVSSSSSISGVNFAEELREIGLEIDSDNLGSIFVFSKDPLILAAKTSILQRIQNLFRHDDRGQPHRAVCRLCKEMLQCCRGTPEDCDIPSNIKNLSLKDICG